MKTLLLDIETAPNKAYVWGLWKQNIALNQIEESGYVLCWSAKWLDGDELMFASCQKKFNRGRMLKQMHALLTEADTVLHYNGKKFDVPTLNKEFVKYGLKPPAPFRQIDLMRVVKKEFRFESNRLDYICQALGIGAKVKHEGFELWIKCMAGDPEAWRKMEEYNRGDVVLLEKLYLRLQPWIAGHPNVSAYTDVACCPKCGSTRFQCRGTTVAMTNRYTRYQCQACAGWFRGTKTVTERGTVRMANIA